MAIVNYKNYSETELMKTLYGKYEDKQFAADVIVYGMANKVHNLTGKDLVSAVRLSLGAGVGAGSLPEASKHKVAQYIMETKKLYARQKIDRESIYASGDKLGAFASFMKEYKEVTEKSFNLYTERQMIRNDIEGTGIMAVGDDTTNVVAEGGDLAGQFTVTLDADTNMFQFEVGHIIQLVTDIDTTAVAEAAITYSIEAKDPAAKTLRLLPSAGGSAIAGKAGTDPIEATEGFVMQNSLNQELPGLIGILSATTGSYMGLDIQYRWQAHQLDASSPSLGPVDAVNTLLTTMQMEVGDDLPDVILTAPDVYIALVNSLEEKKEYQLPIREKRLEGQVGYNGVKFFKPDGKIAVVRPNRFLDSGSIMLLNTSKITWYDRHAPQWFSNDGTTILRQTDDDSYEARYGTYANWVVNPHFQGYITNVALSS